MIENLNIPNHVGIIMDGNGRWAKERGMIRTMGHKTAVKTLKKLCIHMADVGVKYCSLYAFSTENFKRDKKEVGELCGDFVNVIVATGFNEVRQRIEMDAAQEILDGAEGKKAKGVLAGTMEEGAKLCIKYSKPGDIILHIGPVIMHDRPRIVSSIKKGLKEGCLEYEGKFEYEG